MENFTPEQLEEFEAVFDYQDLAETTEEEWKQLEEMFATPEKIKVLRKALQIFTLDERGLTIPTKTELLDKSDDLAHYGMQVMIRQMADEHIRKSLFSLYVNLRRRKVDEAKEKAQAINDQEAKEEKKKEELKKETEQANKQFGDNI